MEEAQELNATFLIVYIIIVTIYQQPESWETKQTKHGFHLVSASTSDLSLNVL